MAGREYTTDDAVKGITVTEINYVSKIQQLHVKIGLPTRTISSNLIFPQMLNKYPSPCWNGDFALSVFIVLGAVAVATTRVESDPG